MNINDLKKYISDDSARIVSVLEFYECHSISANRHEIRCAAPNGANNTAVVVKVDEKLFATFYSDSTPYRGDLIGLCMHFSSQTFKDTMINIHALFGLSMRSGERVKHNYNPVQNISKYVQKKQKSTEQKNLLYEKSILSQYIEFTHADLFQEAILPKIAKQFCIGYDIKKNRITFPHFDWYDFDKVVGIQGRITGLSTEQANLLGVPKYWNYIKGYKKSLNLYGWGFAKNGVFKHKKLILFEAEKSVLKQFSYENGDGYSVALGGHEISEQQVRFILKNTPIDTEIVIAFDKDIMKDESYLIKCCKLFSIYRKTSYIYDRFDNGKILKSKDSPVDNGFKIYKFLFSESERRFVE